MHFVPGIEFVILALVTVVGLVAIVLRVQNDKKQKQHAELLQALRHQGDL